ncbi:MAG: glycosyltransferase family 4 protein [Nanoarchaeota archaeon]
MKILTNTNFHSAGGIAKSADELARYCRRNNLPLVLVGADPQAQFSRSVNGSVVTYRLPVGKGIENSRQVYSSAQNLNDLHGNLSQLKDSLNYILSQEKPDIVLTQGTFYAPWMLHHVAKTKKIPTVVAYAGILTKEEAHAPRPLLSIFEAMEQEFNEASNFYIFPSRLTKTEVEKIFGRSLNDSSRVIPNGVSQEFFERRKVGCQNEGIGFVGRNHEIKNLEFLLQLADNLKGSKNNFSISAVSNIREGEPIRSQLTERGVSIHDSMGLRELRDYYHSNGVVISPSHFETYGNVPLESVSAGTPALVSKNMGVSEVFQNLGLSNLVVDFNNVLEVIAKIREVNTERISGTVKSAIRDSLSWPNIVDQYLNFARELTS